MMEGVREGGRERDESFIYIRERGTTLVKVYVVKVEGLRTPLKLHYVCSRIDSALTLAPPVIRNAYA